MSVTQTQFELTVFQKVPGSIISHDHDPTTGELTLFALSDANDALKSYIYKYLYCFAAWEKDCIIKDTIPIFNVTIPALTTAGPGSISVGGMYSSPVLYTPSSPTNPTPPDGPPPRKVPICECGTDKHGFASHATWCDKHERNLKCGA